MRSLTQVTPPATEPIDLTTAKQHLRQDVADDDTLIGYYIMTARTFVEETLKRSLITQTWDYTIDSFPWSRDEPIEIPRPPLQSVTSITYTDSGGAPTVWGSSNYQVDAVNEWGRIMPVLSGAWPNATLRAMNGVVIRFVAGYGVASAIPWNYRAAMLLLIGHYYENREPIMAQRGVTPIEIPFTVMSLLRTNEVAGVS